MKNEETSIFRRRFFHKVKKTRIINLSHFFNKKNILVDDFLSENGFECNEAPSSPDGLGMFSNNMSMLTISIT